MGAGGLTGVALTGEVFSWPKSPESFSEGCGLTFLPETWLRDFLRGGLTLNWLLRVLFLRSFRVAALDAWKNLLM